MEWIIQSESDGDIMVGKWKVLTISVFLILGLFGNVSISSFENKNNSNEFGDSVRGDSGNVPPVVEIVPDVSSGKAPLAVSFNGEAYDDGEIFLLEWDFEGDGVFEVVQSVEGLQGSLKVAGIKNALQKKYTYMKPGIFHALLRVTDDTGERAVSSVTVQVYSDVPRLDVVPCNREGFVYMAQAGYEAFFGGIESIQFQIKDAWILYQLKDQYFGEIAKVKGVPEGNMIRYYNVYPGIDVRYTIYEDLLLEEFIVLQPMDVSVIEQMFQVHNVEYTMHEDGSIGFYNGEDLVFSIPQPVMYELDNPQKKCYGLHYEIVEQGDHFLLKKVIDDQEWLKTAQYPVVIDSSTQGEIADPWEQQGLTPYGQYFKNVNEYVDPLTGHLTIRHTDYTLSGRGLDVAVTRVYSTVVAYKQEEDGSGEFIPVATHKMAPTDLGCGWSLDFPWLEIDDDEPGKYFHTRNGTQVRTQFQNGVWLCDEYGFTMYVNGDNTYTKYRDDGIKEEYDSMGRITSITDLNQNQVTFSYYPYGIASITDTVGRVLTFSYSEYKLTSVTDGTRTITYSYSGDKLVSVTDPLGRVTSYEYLSENSFLITGVHYPSGGFSSYEYTAVIPSFAKVAPYKSLETDNGETDYYVYKVDSSDAVSWTSPKDVSTVTVSAGRPCVFQRDDGSLVMYFKDKYVWTETIWKCVGGDCWEETVTHTEWWIKRSISTDQHHWSTPQNVVQVKNTTGNPVVIEKQDGSFIMYYKDKYVWTEEECEWVGRFPDIEYVCETTTHTEYWIYRRTSSDGLIWGGPAKVQKSTLGVTNIAVIQKHDSTFLMCYTDKVGSSYYIRQKTSSNGTSWSAPSNVVLVNSSTGNPALLQGDTGTVFLAYRKGSNIYVLSNSGSSWSTPVQTTASAEGDPALLQTADIVIIYKGTDDKCYRISSSNGTIWSSPLQIAPNKALSDPATVDRKDRFYRVTTQYISASAVDLVKVTEYSYEGNGYLSKSTDVVIRDAQTVQSFMHFEYDSKGRPIERISKDEQGTQMEKTSYTFNNANKVIRQDLYAGTSTSISYSITTGYDNWGNIIYTRGPEGAEYFYSYSNTHCENQFVDSKGAPVDLFSNTFYTNAIPSECHTLMVGSAFINSGKVTETYYKYNTNGNMTETKILFPTRNYAVFSGTFDENGQTTFDIDLTGLTITDGILVISSIAVPTHKTLFETHSEVGKGWLNTGTWSGKYFMADYYKCVAPEDCFDGQTRIGPFEHYPGTPNYTEYTTWVEDNTQYVKTSYTAIMNEYPETVEYNLNNSSWITITDNLNSGTTSTTIPAASFVEGLNTFQFREDNTCSTKCGWVLHINQGATPQEYTTRYTHDSYGNLTARTNAQGHTTTYEYAADYQYAYLTSRTDMVDGQEITVSATYDFYLGYITSKMCACGSVTDYEYDSLGRLTKVIHPLVSGEQGRAAFEIVYDDVNNTITLYNENNHRTMRYYDGLGRMVKEEKYTDVLWAVWLYQYNYLDKPIQVTDPLSQVYQYEYDSFGRATTYINPDQTVRTLAYNDVDNTITIKDENQHQKEYHFGWAGTVLSVTEYNGNSYLTQYQYDESGNITQMIDPEQNVYTYVYDSVFGITKAVYPDNTEQCFTYDSVGNAVERIDQNNTSITYTYDALSRLKQINYQDTAISFTYDPAGSRTSMITPDVANYYVYDERNRLTQQTYLVDNTSYTIEYGYDPSSNITAVTYPDNTVVQYTYLLDSYLESIKDYATFSYFSDGNLDEILFSNNVTTDYTYNSTGRVQSIHAKTTADLLDLTYSYDDAGNITHMQNNFLADQQWFAFAEHYTYDGINRLLSASNGFGTRSYEYDSKKRLSVTENGDITSYVYDYDLLVSAGQKTFTYDANGNQLTKSAEHQWVYHYDNANRLINVDRNGQSFAHYVYDGDGKRIKKTEWSDILQDYTTTTYVYSGLDVVYEETSTGTAVYVFGPSGRIAKQTTINNETNTFFYTTDHVGSTRIVTDENGTPLTSVSYYPFGKTHQYTGSPEPYMFTGKEQDATGLYYFNARYYDPETGRFITRDPYTFLPDDPRIIGKPQDRAQWLMNPQRFDRFSYAQNNPLRYTDPTGLDVNDGCCDDNCELLCDGDHGTNARIGNKNQDPPPENVTPDPEDSENDNDGYKSRQEKCEDCTCKDRQDIKELRKLKRNVNAGTWGVTVTYGILCGIAAAMACVASGAGAPVSPLCGLFGGAACAAVFGFLTNASVQDIIDDIHWVMDSLGCSCAIYC